MMHFSLLAGDTKVTAINSLDRLWAGQASRVFLGVDSLP